MNHLRWDLDCRFAGDKNNAPPITFFHAREIVAAEAHATQKVHFEKTQPVGIGLVDALRGASVYDDACPLSRQAPRYSETDAGRGACDKCAFFLELQIHSALDETPTKKIQVA